MKKYLQIVETPTGKVEKQFDITNRSATYIDRLWGGIAINLDCDRFHI